MLSSDDAIQKSREIRRANKTACIFCSRETFSSSVSFSRWQSGRLHVVYGRWRFPRSVFRKPPFERAKPINCTVAGIWFRARPTIRLWLLTYQCIMTRRLLLFFDGKKSLYNLNFFNTISDKNEYIYYLLIHFLFVLSSLFILIFSNVPTVNNIIHNRL